MPTTPTPPADSNHLLRKWTIIALTMLAAFTTYHLLPDDMNELARRTTTIFLTAAIFWATEVIPLYATSLCIIALQIIFLADNGGLAETLPTHSAWPLDPQTGDPLSIRYSDFFKPFASPIIILFMGGFLLSAGMSKHGIDRAIAARLLQPVAHKPFTLIFAIMGISAMFSMWMSNTATAAMMLAIVAPLLKQLPPTQRYARGLILAVPFGANIGGLGTPIGSPPNAVAMAAIHESGLDLSFVDWMLIGFPLVCLLLIFGGTLLCYRYRPTEKIVFDPIKKAAAITLPGKRTLAVMLIAIALWLTGNLHGIAPAAVALLAAAALTALSVLDKNDVDSINWNILLLMWGGLSLGQSMQITGLVEYIVTLTGENIYPSILTAVMIVLAVALSGFMSNTAAASLLIPMALALAPENPITLCLATAMACSISMAMPVSTPPNAIAFSTGRIPVKALIFDGGIITLTAMMLLLWGYDRVIPFILSFSG